MLLQQHLNQNPRYRDKHSSLLGNLNKEYVPLFALDQRVLTSSRNVPSGDFNALINQETIRFKGDNPLEIPLMDIIKKTIYDLNIDLHGGPGIHYIEELETCFNELFPKAIDNYINDFSNYSIDIPSNHSGTSYDDLFQSLDKNQWYITSFRNNRIITNLHFCASYSDSSISYIDHNGYNGTKLEYNIKPLFTLVVKPEFMPYIRLCWLLGEEPDYSIFELWIDSEFDNKGTEFKFLRSKFKNLYLPKIENLGIEVKKVSNIMDKLFYKIQVPNSIKTIKDRKDWINLVSKETIDLLKSKLALNRNKIILTP